MTRTVTLRLDGEAYEVLREAARADNRSLSNLIETAALAKVREEQFADDQEMAEILSNENLLRRLRAGSRDARRRRGRILG